MKFSNVLCLALYFCLHSICFANDSPLLVEIIETLKDMSGRMRQLEESSNRMSQHIDAIEDKIDNMMEVASDLDDLYACKTPRLLHTDLYDIKEDRVYIYGAEIQVNCHYGYERIGDEYIQCLGKGKWSDTHCKPIDCGKPPLSEFGTFGVDFATTYNSTLTLTCVDGYGLAGNDVIRCDGENGWEGVQYCLPRVCFDVPVETNKNSKECFLKHKDFRFNDPDFLFMWLSHTQVLDDEECATFCITHNRTTLSIFTVTDYDPYFPFIEVPFKCVCYPAVNHFYSYYPTQRYDIYFREDRPVVFPLD